MNLTEHFTLEEFIKSDTAKRLGINNEPPMVQQGVLKHTCKYFFEPLRALLNIKYVGRIVNNKIIKKVIINITSGYRCDKLNLKVGGKSNSRHCSGEAGDFEAVLIFIDNTKLVLDYRTLFNDIRDFTSTGLISVDQCIQEKSGDAKWVHCSYSIMGADKNRKQFFEINS